MGDIDTWISDNIGFGLNTKWLITPLLRLHSSSCPGIELSKPQEDGEGGEKRKRETPKAQKGERDP